MPLNNASYIFVLGGWDANLDYVDVVEVILRTVGGFSKTKEFTLVPKVEGTLEQLEHVLFVFLL